MQFEDTAIAGVKIATPKKIGDARPRPPPLLAMNKNFSAKVFTGGSIFEISSCEC